MNSESRALYDVGQDSKIVLLTGAGASAFVGLPTLENIAKEIKTSLIGEVGEVIQKTWDSVSAFFGDGATFEQVLGRLQFYHESAKLLEEDDIFQEHFGTIPQNVRAGHFKRFWKNAIIGCYRALLDNFGPSQIQDDLPELTTTMDIFKSLACYNNNKLHIFTTNYDCSYNLLANKSTDISFVSHIMPEEGTFHDTWYYRNANLSNKDLPAVYIHRLHGCIAWFRQQYTPYGLVEVYSRQNNIPIDNDETLSNMCIKLVSSEEIGPNPAFRLAFNEFYDLLRSCRILLVWGHGFRDVEVLRTIHNAIEARGAPLHILYIDPYVEPDKAGQRIRDTLTHTILGSPREIQPQRIEWVIRDGRKLLLTNIIGKIEEILTKEEESK